MDSKLTTFGKVWCWLCIIANTITGLAYLFSKASFEQVFRQAGLAIDLGMLTVQGIASLVLAGCFAWLFFGQKKMAFYAVIAMSVVAAIINMLIGFGIVTAILGLGLSVLVNWLIFRKSLEFLD